MCLTGSLEFTSPVTAFTKSYSLQRDGEDSITITVVASGIDLPFTFSHREEKRQEARRTVVPFSRAYTPSRQRAHAVKI